MSTSLPCVALRRAAKQSEAGLVEVIMYFVYLLESLVDSSKRYVGFTAKGVESRLEEHNTGKSIHTNKHKPWKCIAYFAFENQAKAEKFELYLKHGSGHAFAKKHLW